MYYCDAKRRIDTARDILAGKMPDKWNSGDSQLEQTVTSSMEERQNRKGNQLVTNCHHLNDRWSPFMAIEPMVTGENFKGLAGKGKKGMA